MGSPGFVPPSRENAHAISIKDSIGKKPSVAMISISALECGVCLSLVCQPVSLSCGHSFCRVCLVNTLRRNKKRCPTCRAVCHNSAEDQPEDVMISNIVHSCFPELAERRRREVEADQHQWRSVLPVFYYNVPKFPGENLNLHLFEPRYKLMIKRIHKSSRRFVYVPNYSDYVAKVGDVALIADVRKCEFLPDGRVLLDAKLTSRHTVAEQFVEDGTQGLHYCRVEARGDEPPSDDKTTVRLAELERTTRVLAERVIEPVKAQVTARYGEMPSATQELSLWVTAVLPMSVEEKHELLAGTSTIARLEACRRLLSSLDPNRPPKPPTPVPASAVAEAYKAYATALRRGAGAERAASAAAGAATASLAGVEPCSPGENSNAEVGREHHEALEISGVGPSNADSANASAVAAYERTLAAARNSLEVSGASRETTSVGGQAGNASASDNEAARSRSPVADVPAGDAPVNPPMSNGDRASGQ